VRLDARVEQVFDVINGLTRRQPQSAAQNLQARVCLSVCLRPFAFVVRRRCFDEGCVGVSVCRLAREPPFRKRPMSGMECDITEMRILFMADK
jgi:hypothetical protein